MSKTKDEMRDEYRREDLGKGVRGKYFARVAKGTNLVLLAACRTYKSFQNNNLRFQKDEYLRNLLK